MIDASMSIGPVVFCSFISNPFALLPPFLIEIHFVQYRTSCVL